MGSKIQDQKINYSKSLVARKKGERLHSHRSAILWFTGLSGSGKSTLANFIEKELRQLGCHTVVLDGDVIRRGLCSDLGFSEQDRTENIRRIGEVAKLFLNARVFPVTAFISPFKTDRDRVRKLVSDGEFIEIYCKCSLEKCEERDVKGLYALARKGTLKEFTGISSPYEAPDQPDLVLDTENLSVEDCGMAIMEFLSGKHFLQKLLEAVI